MIWPIITHADSYIAIAIIKPVSGEVSTVNDLSVHVMISYIYCIASYIICPCMYASQHPA